MGGHGDNDWGRLHVLYLGQGPETAPLEASFIRFAQEQYPPRQCHNRALDYRGQVRGVPNFMCLVLRVYHKLSSQHGGCRLKELPVDV